MPLHNATRNSLTLILLNWKRPANVRRIVRAYICFSRIDEIIIWNNNPATKLRLGIRDEKIKYFESHNHFTVSRYAATLFSRNEDILFHDDDLIFTEQQIERLFDVHLAYPKCIIGCFGRNLENGAYIKKYFFGKVDIILGRIMLFRRELVANFIKNCPPYSGDLEDDILFCLSQKRKHVAVNTGAVQELPRKYALSARPYHTRRRQEMVDYCMARDDR